MNRDDRRLRDKNNSQRGELKGYDMPYAFRSSLLVPIPNVTPNRQLDSSSSSVASGEKKKRKRKKMYNDKTSRLTGNANRYALTGRRPEMPSLDCLFETTDSLFQEAVFVLVPF